MPRWDVASQHQVLVRASTPVVFAAVKRLDLGSSRAASALFRLRGMPRSAQTLEGLLQLGFGVLAEHQDHEIVFGLAGRFWTPRGQLQRVKPEAFVTPPDVGTARAVWSFLLEPASSSSVRLTTETRVLCSDARTRSRFRMYWRVVGPFSGFIRREALRLIREDAECGR